LWDGCGRAISVHGWYMNECDDVVVFDFVGDWSTVSVGSKREKCIEWDGEGRVEYKGWLS